MVYTRGWVFEGGLALGTMDHWLTWDVWDSNFAALRLRVGLKGKGGVLWIIGEWDSRVPETLRSN